MQLRSLVAGESSNNPLNLRLTQAKCEIYTQTSTNNPNLSPIVCSYYNSLLLALLLLYNDLGSFNQQLGCFNNLAQMV